MEHLAERLILGGTWLTAFFSLFLIPQAKARNASFIYLFTQLPSWLFGLIAVEAGLLDYPYRELAEANATSVTFEYLVLPLLCVFFNLYYPRRPDTVVRLGYYLAVGAAITALEYFLERFTDLIEYNTWDWYWTFLTLTLFMYLVRVVYKWFFRMHSPLGL